MKDRLHVLLVEDNADEALSLKMALEMRPEVIITTEWAPTVASAITRLKRGGVDAVLLDLTMPDGQGPDVVRRITEAAPEIYSVVYTGRSKEEVEHPVKEAGALAVVQKPACSDEITKKLRFAVAYRNADRAREEFDKILAELGEVMDEAIKGGVMPSEEEPTGRYHK
jgi:sigma-B regulation protein RsbU (phosphoserine phosphatase)